MIRINSYDLKYVSDNGNVIQFGYNPGFVIASIDDMSAVSVDVKLSQGRNYVGGVVQGESVRHKDLTVLGTIVGKVNDGVINRRKMLLDAIPPQVGGRFVYNDEWELVVRPTVLPSIQNRADNARFQFSVRAPYPYWLGKKQQIKLSGLTNVHNDGNVPANFAVTFQALTRLSNPQLASMIRGILYI